MGKVKLGEVLAGAVQIPNPCRRAWGRLAGTGGPGGARARFRANELDGIALVPTEGDGLSTSLGNADRDIRRMGSMSRTSGAQKYDPERDRPPREHELGHVLARQRSDAVANGALVEGGLGLVPAQVGDRDDLGDGEEQNI